MCVIFSDNTPISYYDYSHMKLGNAMILCSQYCEWPQRWSCTATLRIIRSARESGKISPFHYRARRLDHDSTPFFLSARATGIAVVVFHAALWLASAKRHGTTAAT